MNSWLLVRRLRGPAFLLLFGITALLNQWDILSFGQSWPLYLILWGTLTLIERAAFTELPVPPSMGSYPPQQPPAPPTAPAGTSIVPERTTLYSESQTLTRSEEER